MIGVARNSKQDVPLIMVCNEKKKCNVRIDTVSPWASQAVWESETRSNGEKVDVEVVVHQIELLGRGKRTSGTVDFAGKFGVSGIIFIFPHLKNAAQ